MQAPIACYSSSCEDNATPASPSESRKGRFSGRTGQARGLQRGRHAHELLDEARVDRIGQRHDLLPLGGLILGPSEGAQEARTARGGEEPGEVEDADTGQRERLAMGREPRRCVPA